MKLLVYVTLQYFPRHEVDGIDCNCSEVDGDCTIDSSSVSLLLVNPVDKEINKHFLCLFSVTINIRRMEDAVKSMEFS